MPAELAPFLAKAWGYIEAATDGLQPHEAIAHLETTLARAEIEASRLGIRFDQGPLDTDGLPLGEAGAPVVVIHRLVDADPDA